MKADKMTWYWYGVSLLVIALDQWTKRLAEARLSYGEAREVTSWFDLTLAYNRGAAFSFLSDAGGWQRWLFTLIAAVVAVAITVWIWRLGSRQRILGLGLALILGSLALINMGLDELSNPRVRRSE